MIRVVTLALAGWVVIAAQTPPPATIVYGWVEDDRGQPLTGLELKDFEALVDGRAVPIESITLRTAPASIVLLLDATRSTEWTPRPLDEHVGTFTAALEPQDRLVFAAIADGVTFSAFKPANVDVRDDVRRAVETGDKRGSGNSPIWDALHEAITRLAAQPPPRTILLVSDGRATGNTHGMVEVADYAMANGVAINIILKHTAQRIRQSARVAALVQPNAPLEGVTAYTGGVLFFYPMFQDLPARDRFAHLAASVRALHAFAFTPPVRDGQAHQLELRGNRPGVVVHAPLAFVAR